MSPITPINLPALPQMSAAQAGGAQGYDFQAMLRGAIGQVENARSTANDAIQKFVAGQNQELHSTVLATQNAELQFEMLMQVRNKVVSAYEEIMRMQL